MFMQQLVGKIKTYIDSELQDSIYYLELAKNAPTKLAKEVLMGLSEDERSHAKNFMEIYENMTGNKYTPPEIAPPSIPDFKNALQERMLAETCDYRKYGLEYIEAEDKLIKHLFFMIKTSEACHAMRIPLLLEEAKV